MSINLTVISGRVSSKPNFYKMNNHSVCRFNIAINEKYKNKATGEYEQTTQFIPVVVVNQNQAKYIVENINIGDMVAITGKIYFVNERDPKYPDRFKVYFSIFSKQFNLLLANQSTPKIKTAIKVGNSKLDQEINEHLTKDEDFPDDPSIHYEED